MIRKAIDQTLLATDATDQQIEALCEGAREWGFAAVCVQPCRVKRAAALLAGSSVKVATVIGFPQGANTAEVKAFEAARAVKDGADELDMVINVGALKDGAYDVVRGDIEAVVKSADGKCVKVILECCLLTDDEKKIACRLAVEAGAGYVKTSTGMSTGGATAADTALMRAAVGQGIGVKAAGGIRDLETAREMIAAGATRIGTSRGVEIAREEK